MSPFRWVQGVFRSLFRKAEMDRDLEAELDSVLAMLVEEKLRAGLGPAEALREARIEIGGAEQVKERVREERLGAGLDSLVQDLRYSIRSMRRSGGLTTIAALILAIAIGANTSLYSSVHAVLFRSLPFPEPQRLVVGLKTLNGEWGGSVSRVDYFDYREMASSFQALGALANFTMQHTVTGGGDPELVQAGYVTWNLFPALGVSPVAGRSFLPEEEAQGGASTVLISYGFWQGRLGGSPEAVGSVVTLDGQPQTVVGIMPPGFRFLFDADLWRLVDADGPFDGRRDSYSHLLVGRLEPGVSMEQAQAEVDGISAALASEYPESNTGKGLRLDNLHDYMVRNVRTSLLFLFGTAVAVLLIACGNVAGLLLARGERRQAEMAMRTALGASRSRLVRQLLAESLVLTVAAGALGMGLAFLLKGVLLRLLPMGEVGLQPYGLSSSALGFTLLLSLATGILVGLIPAIRTSSLEPAKQIRAETRSTPSARSSRIQSGLVAFQVALSVVLLIGSGLLVRSLAHLTGVELGFDPENLLTGQLQIQAAAYPTPSERNLFFSTLLNEVNAVPGVEGATLANKLPILSRWQDWSVWPVGHPPASSADDVSAMARWVPPGYFPTMRIPLLAGREIEDTDSPGSPFVVVLSRSVAETLFPGADPLGNWVRIGDWRDCLVTGVAEDARVNTLRGGPDGAVYMAAAQMAPLMLQIAVRTSGNPELLIQPIRDLLHRKDPTVLFAQPRSMASVVDAELVGFRTISLSLTLFSAVAVALTAIGLYGLLAYQVTQRKAELGLRLAVGASEHHLVSMILRRGLVLAGAGLVAGLAVAYPGTRAVRSLLFDVRLLDPAVYFSAALALLLVAGLASYLPARRAARGNVADVLRTE